MTAAHLASRPAIGDTLFCADLVALAVILGRRFITRGDLPPANFVLVGGGLLNGIAGAAIVAFASALADWPRLYTFGMLALTQGFGLMPILGVGVFFFPRFLGVPFGSEAASLREPMPAVETPGAARGGRCRSRQRLVRSGKCGFPASCGRAAIHRCCGLHGHANGGRIEARKRSIFRSMRSRCRWMLLLGLLWPVFFSSYRVAGLHLVFIGGFMLTVLTVATRVMLGHSGQVRQCNKPLPLLHRLRRFARDRPRRTRGRRLHAERRGAQFPSYLGGSALHRGRARVGDPDGSPRVHPR